MESLALAVPRKRAEQIRKRLVDSGALRTDLLIASDSKKVYFPISRHIDLGLTVITRNFREQKPLVRDYRDLLDLPEELKSLLPSSYDIIGHVAVVKLPEELLSHKKAIGKAIAEANKPVRTVCLDEGVKGETRTRALKIAYGKKETLTTYREHGLSFEVDPRTMFFSPRLATERKIVSDQVAEGETVLDMFAGVGPFSVIIAKTRSPERVYACDVNERAYELLVRNMRANRVEDRMDALLGDVREVADQIPEVDRVIMNLPHSAFDFLDVCAKKLRGGGKVHYYEIIESNALDDRLAEIEKRLRGMGRLTDSVEVRVVKSYSPTMNFYAVDMVIV